MNRMKLMCSLAVVLGMAVGASAATKKSAGGSKTLTGCLQKGDEAGTYKLTNVAGGKDWELIDAPAALKMDDHVGHKISVTGSAVSAGTAMKMEHKSSTDAAAKAEEHAEQHLKVHSMKHIAGTCP